MPRPCPLRAPPPSTRTIYTLSRRSALRLLRATLGVGDWLRADVDPVNAHLLAAPELTLLGAVPRQSVRHPLGEQSPMARLLAGLAAEVRDATQRQDLALCGAPGCGHATASSTRIARSGELGNRPFAS